MARSSATAAVLLLVLALLAVAHCRRTVAADDVTEPESTAGSITVSDENGLSNPTLPAESGASATEDVLPAEQQQGFLRLPSHRPCRHHLWWPRHHRDAPRRFHYSRHGESREVVSHLAVLPEEETREAMEVKPVAEPDPDRSLPDSDGEGEQSTTTTPTFGDDTDGAHEAAHDHHDERAAVWAWKKEMLRRWFHFHHGMRHHHLHHIHHDDKEEDEAAPEGMKLSHMHHHHHHHDDEEDEEKNMMRKRLRHAEHDENDSDDEEEQLEEMVRRFRKAIMMRRFGHGRRFIHHPHHNHSHRRHADDAGNADGQEESGVMAWIKGLMNQF